MKFRLMLLTCAAAVMSSVAVSAEDFDLNMKKAKLDGVTYGWAEVYKAEKPAVEPGLIAYQIKDYDKDGQDEMLTVELCTDKADDTYYAAVRLNMYEADGRHTQTDEYNVISSSTDAGGMECITKNGYIALQCAMQNNTFADGAEQNINIFSYDGQKFVNVLNSDFGGSSVDIELNSPVLEGFKKLGFDGTYRFMSDGAISEEGVGYYSPYFVGEDENGNTEFEFNIARLEQNCVPVAEMVVTNNRYEVMKDYDYGNYDNDDYNARIVESQIMKIFATDFGEDMTDMDPTPDEIAITVNGTSLNSDVPAYIENSRTMVPMRAIFEALSAKVDYDAQTKTVTASKDGISVELVTGAATAKVNGTVKSLDAPVANKDGRTMVPLRFVSESLGAKVDWDGANRIVTITAD